MSKITNYKTQFLFLTFALIQIHCSHQKLATPVYRVEDPVKEINSDIMAGNYIDAGLPEKNLIALNPGHIVSKHASSYYVLNLVYISETDSLVIGLEDEIQLSFDKNILKLKPFNVQVTANETVAFYEIEPFDLVDISNATNVRVLIYAQNRIIDGRFTQDNVHNFKKFTAKYILDSDFKPQLPEFVPVEKWGFISAGGGTGYEFWLGRYLNLFQQKKSAFREYLSVGAGFSGFDYEVLGIRQSWIDDPENPMDSVLAVYYWQDEYNTDYYPYLGVMYGISNNKIIKNWSVELGITLQYFFLPEWQGEVDSIYIAEKGDYYATKQYQLVQGNLFDGFSAGIFLQIGGIWGRINTKKSWAAGLSLPLPWW